jgi:xylulose-5-phosphate/fructose-6-phosphate phosphoketolase
MRRFFKEFSFPGGIGSHCTPETPGSIHEGGELGYSVSHAFGAAFDNPDLLVAVMVGDGEAETGPLATSWHSNKFLNPIRDGAVLPILHLNGYKINNPTCWRASPTRSWKTCSGLRLDAVFRRRRRPDGPCMPGHGRGAGAVRAGNPPHPGRGARSGIPGRPRWPMIVLRSPKGWTGPAEVDGKKVEGFWRAHQVPWPTCAATRRTCSKLEAWLRSYRPEELFDETAACAPN